MKNKILLALVACVTLGLAPHSEPHIWKQIQNLRYGRMMEFMDWVDVLLHGAPWVLLLAFVGLAIKEKMKSKQQPVQETP
jgi:hypothetical protein